MLRSNIVVKGQQIFELRRRLITSFLDVLILSELKEKPLWGYDLILLIHRKFNVLLATGSIYNLLYRLEKEGLIQGTQKKRRKIYKLTRKGEETARETVDIYRKIEAFIRYGSL